jgi:hypothetical protein
VEEFKRQRSPALFHQLDIAGDWDLTYEGAESTGFCLKINVNLKIHLQDDPDPFLSLRGSQQQQLIREIKNDPDSLKEIRPTSISTRETRFPDKSSHKVSPSPI